MYASNERTMEMFLRIARNPTKIARTESRVGCKLKLNSKKAPLGRLFTRMNAVPQ